MMKKLTILLSSFAVAACVTGYSQIYRFNQIQLVNLSDSTIGEVDIRVLDSEKAVSCEKVAKNAICDDRFGARRYPQRGIELSWTHPGGNRKTELLTPRMPVSPRSASPLRIVIEVYEDGSANAFFENSGRGSR